MRLILTSLLLLSSSFAVANDCKFSAERSVDLDAAGLRALRFELGSSDLKVQGVAGLAKAEVRAKACASEQAWLSELNIAQSRVGDKALIKAEPHEHHSGWLGNTYAYLDFDVRVPLTLALEVDAGSGDAQLDSIAALDFHSGSGDLVLGHVAGAVSVKVGSGDVTAADVGSFSLGGSGSGDIHVSGVRGAVTVAHVGSGDLHFDNVQGGVQVESIGSGDLQTEHIGGDVVLGSIGSGDVSASRVTGNLIVKSAGSGDIHHDQIGGRIEVPKKHAAD
jgi:Putative adhesin